MGSSNGGGGEEELKKMAELSKTLKEGERIVAPTRRSDGTLRKPIRIRAGYVPQEEVAIYQSKGALLRKELMALPDVPPGYDPVLDAKPKTKCAKRNERKKEKRLQAAVEKGKNVESIEATETNEEGVLPAENPGSTPLKSLTSQMNELSVSTNPIVDTPLSDAKDTADAGALGQDIDKRIRTLKKKVLLLIPMMPLILFLLTHCLLLIPLRLRSCPLMNSFPLLFVKAFSHSGWCQAMVEEMAALHANGTWELVRVPPGHSTVGCRWVYTVKVGSNGQVDRLKTWLVAKGYTQTYGFDLQKLNSEKLGSKN